MTSILPEYGKSGGQGEIFVVSRLSGLKNESELLFGAFQSYADAYRFSLGIKSDKLHGEIRIKPVSLLPATNPMDMERSSEHQALVETRRNLEAIMEEGVNHGNDEHLRGQLDEAIEKMFREGLYVSG